MSIYETNETDFDIYSAQNILLEFYSPECTYCKMAELTLQKLSDEYKNIRFLKANAHENPEMSNRYGIRGLPTFIFFSDGKESGRLTGAKGENALRELIHRE